MRRATGVAIVAALLSACTAQSSTPDSSPPRTVTLITHDSFDVSKSVLRAFEAQTGIQVTLVPTGDAGQEVNRAILTAGNPEGDVLFGIDNSLLQAGLDANLFVPYASPRLAQVPGAFQLDPQHRVTPIDHADVCVNVDDAWFAAHHVPPPSSLAALADPAYRDLLVVENPATSSPGLAFLLATVAAEGADGWQSYWSRLRANGVTVVDGWERAYYGEFSGAGGGHGTHPLVVSYATDPAAEVVFSKPRLDHAPTSIIVSTCYRQIEFAGILAGTTHQAEARALIDFLLSRPFQEDVPLKMFVYPVASDAALPDVFQKYAVLPPDPLSLDPATIAANRGDWLSRWTDLMLR